MSWLVTAAEMREMDRITIEELGVPSVTLMETAGRTVADEAAAMCRPGGRVAIVCGAGGNGGDGFVAARLLRERGFDARVLLAAGRPRAGGDAAHHLERLERAGGPIADLAGREDDVLGADLVVDALLGTGLENAVREPHAGAIALMNRAAAPRLAVDVPSGLDSDTGRPLGAAVRADATVTFAFAKVGLVGSPGFEWAGRVRVVDIGIPAHLAERLGVKVSLLDERAARALVPRRARGGHKGAFGHLLVVAGSPGRTGAALLAAQGGLRGGAGLVTLAVPPAIRAAAEGRVWEAMTAELDLERPREDALAELIRLAAGKRAIAWGPGMPTAPAAGEVLRAALRVLDAPLVLDADALNHLARDTSVLGSARPPLVLTPHPGEAARLLGASTEEIQGDRLGAARRLAAETRAVVVLKGARTVIATPEGRAALNPTGNPGMGTGGAGDVLCGVVGALLAQGLAPFDAACLAAYAHGRAGDLAAAARGEIGLVARDVAEHLPAAFRELLG